MISFLQILKSPVALAKSPLTFVSLKGILSLSQSTPVRVSSHSKSLKVWMLALSNLVSQISLSRFVFLVRSVLIYSVSIHTICWVPCFSLAFKARNVSSEIGNRSSTSNASGWWGDAGGRCGGGASGGDDGGGNDGADIFWVDAKPIETGMVGIWPTPGINDPWGDEGGTAGGRCGGGVGGPCGGAAGGVDGDEGGGGGGDGSGAYGIGDEGGADGGINLDTPKPNPTTKPELITAAVFLNLKAFIKWYINLSADM